MKAMQTLHGHRHSPPGQHEHEYEPTYGLPEALPEGERVLWQGAPDWKTLAVRRFHVRKLVIYFAVLLVVRVALLMSDGMGLGTAVWGSTFLAVLAAIAVGLVSLIAWFTARTTVYTLTDKRVVMRIGIVLTMSLNLPLRRVANADLKTKDGHGDISLRCCKPDHMAYLHLWPHARPGAWRGPNPRCCCLPQAAGGAAAHRGVAPGHGQRRTGRRRPRRLRPTSTTAPALATH
jgi:hypothetical protein